MRGPIVLDYLRRYRDKPSLTIARLLAQDHPLWFSSVEEARSAVRYYRGAHGAKSRQHTAFKRTKEESEMAKSLKLIPQGVKEIRGDDCIRIGADRVLVLSDVHVPFHDKGALEVAIAAGVEAGCDAVILNGDFLDCYSISAHDKMPGMPRIQEEFQVGRQILRALREEFDADTDIYWKEGNHENRWERFLRRKAPELFGVPQFSWQEVLSLDEFGIQWVDGWKHFDIGGLTLWHGHEFKGSSQHPAKWIYEKTKMDAMCGHFHRHDVWGQNDAKRVRRRGFSLGCLCDLRPSYHPNNNWVHGFAIVTNLGDGYEVYMPQIVNGEIVE